MQCTVKCASLQNVYVPLGLQLIFQSAKKTSGQQERRVWRSWRWSWGRQREGQWLKRGWHRAAPDSAHGCHCCSGTAGSHLSGASSRTAAHAVQCAFLRTACKPGQVTRWVRVSSCTPKVCGFDPRSRHRSRLQVRFLVAAHTVGNQCMFSLTAVSLPLFLPPPLPLE